MHVYALAAEIVATLAAEASTSLSMESVASRCGVPVADASSACALLGRWGVLQSVDPVGVALALAPVRPRAPIVLVVENTPAVAHVLAALLESEGYGVMIARTLSLGETVLRTVRPSLVIADSFAATAVAALDGLAPLRDLARPAPVMLFTAHRDLGEAAVRDAGFAGLLPKPFDIDALLDRVATAVRSG